MPEEQIKLNDPSIFAQINELLDRVAREDSLKEALLFKDNLSEKLDKQNIKQENPDLYADYKYLIAKASFVALSALTRKEILDLLRNNFKVSFDLELYDMWEDKLRFALAAIPNLEERAEFKKNILEVLEKNEETITSKYIIRDGDSYEGTVANWLSDYRAQKETGEEKTNSLAVSEYLSNNKNINDLEAGERARVKKLLELYEKLNIPPFSLEGIEESHVFINSETGEITIFNEGVFEDAGKVERKEANDSFAARQKPAEEYDKKDLEIIKERYLGDEKERKNIEEEMNSLGNISSNFPNLEKYFEKAVSSKEKTKVVAVLYILAKNRKIDNLLSQNKFAGNKVEEKIENKENFRINPAHADYVKIFLRSIFEDELGLSENESARLGLHILNILKKQGVDYGNLAYFDMSDKLFKWQK